MDAAQKKVKKLKESKKAATTSKSKKGLVSAQRYTLFEICNMN